MPTMRLPVPLTDQEKIDRGKRMAILEHELKVLDEQRKMQAKAMKAKMEHVGGEIADLSNQLCTGEEMREIEIEYVKDLKSRVENTIRLDTGEVVNTRQLAPEEMQGELKLAENDDPPEVDLQDHEDGWTEQPSQEENNSVVNIEDAKKMDDEELFEMASGFALKQDDPTVVTVERLQFEFKIGQGKAKKLLRRLKEEDLLSYPSASTSEEQPAKETKKEDTSDEWWK